MNPFISQTEKDRLKAGVEDDQPDMGVGHADSPVHQEHRNGDDDGRQHARR
jgi:hypothetical protein